MLTAGPARKVTIHFSENHKYHGQSAYAAILDFLFYRAVSGATVVRGIAGFAADHPVTIEFVESPQKVDELLPKLQEMAGRGLIEVQDTTVVKPSEAATKKASQPSAPALKREGKAKLMRIFIGENDKWHDKPLHKALVESMRANDIAGVTVNPGILGYGANRRIHKDTALHLSHDRPMMLSVVDTEEKLRAFFPVLDQMVQQGLVVLSDVDIIKYTHNIATPERRKEAQQ